MDQCAYAVYVCIWFYELGKIFKVNMGNPGRAWEPGAKQKGKERKKDHINRNNHSLFKNLLYNIII